MRGYTIIECVGRENLDWFMQKYRKNAGHLHLTSFKQLVNILISIVKEAEEDPAARRAIIEALKRRGREDLATIASEIFIHG